MQSQFIGEKQGDLLEQKCVKQKCFAYKTYSIQVQNIMVFGKANDKGF
jgi:hypothetical protein